MTRKQDFLSHIAEQLGRPQQRIPPERKVKGSPDFWRDQLPDSQNKRVERFTHELEQLGGIVQRYSSLSALRTGLDQLLHRLRPQQMLIWDRRQFASWGIDAIVEPWPIQPLESEEDLQEAIHADIGLTTVDDAIADTGSLVLCTDEQKMRAVSLFPTVHIALVDARQIQTHMGEVLATFGSIATPSSVHFISGPSRSSDIENDLSIGVHGPAALYVLINESATD